MIARLLVESSMRPIPQTIKVLSDWGEVTVVSNKGELVAQGEHLELSGEPEEFETWLEKTGSFWRTKPGTSPIMQQFERVSLEG